MLTTTLNKIRKHSPCVVGWEKLMKSLGKTKADDEVLTLEYILESNGLDDALWALRAVDGYQNAMRLYACYCAKRALPAYEKADNRVRACIETAESFAYGHSTREEMAAARAAVLDVSLDAAWEAARNVSLDASLNTALVAARDAAQDAAWDTARASAWGAARVAARAAVLNTARDASLDAVLDDVLVATRDTVGDVSLDVSLDAAWASARDSAWAAARTAALDTARAATWEAFPREFIRLLRLEGEYGNVGDK